MNAPPDDPIAEQALLWAVRVRDPAFRDWDDFSAWLEAAPRNLGAYEAALAEVEGADGLFDTPPEPAWTPSTTTRYEAPLPRWRMRAVALGAAVVAITGGWLALDGRPGARQEYATALGERRTVVLADGSRIVMNGGTRLSLSASDPRDVALAEGEALFDVRHDASRPFVITTSGGTRLVDVGTRFNVDTLDGALDVAVAEGAVMYQGGRGGGGDIRLDAGRMLSRASRDASPVTRSIAPEEIGSWRSGQLHYSDAPLGTLAADLARNVGVRVEVGAGLSGRRFSGTVTLEGGTDVVMKRLGPVLDIGVLKTDRGWRLVPPDAPRP